MWYTPGMRTLVSECTVSVHHVRYHVVIYVVHSDKLRTRVANPESRLPLGDFWAPRSQRLWDQPQELDRVEGVPVFV